MAAMLRALDKLAERDFDAAIKCFSQAIMENSRNYDAWIGRGSAHMFTNQFQRAVDDFTSALDVATEIPEKVDAYKRRGAAQGMLGGPWYTRPQKAELKLTGALRTYDEAIALLNGANHPQLKLQILLERAAILNEIGKFKKAMKDLEVVQRDVTQMMSSRALTILGRALLGTGDIDRALAVFHRAMEMDIEGTNVEPVVFASLAYRAGGGDGLQAIFYLNMALHRLYTACEEPANGWKAAYVWYLRAETWKLKGLHHHALRDAILSIEANPARLEAFSLAIQCARAIGAMQYAVHLVTHALSKFPYDEVFKMRRIEIDMDVKFLHKKSIEFNAEVAMPPKLKEALAKNKLLHHATLKDLFKSCSEVEGTVTETTSVWNLDDSNSLAELARELWRNPALIPEGPADFSRLYSTFVQLPLTDELPLSFVSSFENLDREKVTVAAWHADSIGFLFQPNCRGFLNNIRKHRQGGLASFQMAQLLKKHLRNLHRSGSGVHVPSQGCSKQKARSHSGISMQPLGYREFMDVAIKWRRAAEPEESIFWVDLLVGDSFANVCREMKMIENSCYSIMHGRNIPRCFELLKANLVSTLDNNFNVARILDSPDPISLRAILQDNYSFTTTLKSSGMNSQPSTEVLEGSKLALTADDENEVTFSLKTSNSLSRWSAFQKELTNLWTSLESIAKISDLAARKSKAIDIALLFFYYWANFAPLSNGNSITGLSALYAILMAFDIRLPDTMPPEFQLEWEAILTSDPNTFLRRIRPWIGEHRPSIFSFPNVSASSTSQGTRDTTSLMESCPDIEETCPTPAHAIYILSL